MGTNITGIGNANAIGFKSRVTGGIYFPPELKDALVGVWSAYGKSNDSTDRNIIKNKIKDRGGDFVISNAAFKLNSGFGKYEVDFTTWSKRNVVTSNNDNSFSFESKVSSSLLYYSTTIGVDTPSFKIKANISNCLVYYYYINDKGTLSSISILESGEFELPISHNTLYNGNIGIGFEIGRINGTGTGTITQIPSYQGAFVTDGIDDLITSTKTVQEMGITDEITVVSMIHKISSDNNWSNLIGELKGNHTFVANRGINTDKTGIYGYTYNYNENAIVINNILGDKNDYIVKTSTSLGLDNKYYVTGFTSAGIIQNISQIAWYWTFIANRVLTTDEINQVIAYYNLDRTLKPDILCNTIKQGITNENHAEFGDKLIDYSGNGRDIQMYNLAWKGGSGVAAKKFETIKDYLIVPDEGLQELTIYNEFSYKVKSIKYADRYWTVQSLNKTDVSYPITIIADKDIIWRNVLNYTDENGVKGNIRKETNVPANTPTQVFILGFNDFDVPDNYTKVNCVSYATRTDITEFTVTFIPSCKGGILLNGITDFGQFVGDLGLKDYTLIMNRAYNNLINNQVPLISSNIVEDQTPFIVEHWNTGSNAISFSYGASRTTDIPLDINKKIVYQSTYSYMGYVIPKGNAISTGGGITLGKFGNGVQYSAICLWSLMLFPYSMSEFLIERQLKKHKLGTLYPDMVEFRPVINSNIDIKKINYWDKDWNIVNVGDYVSIGNDIKTNITVPNGYKISKVTSNAFDNITIEKSSTEFIYDVKFYGIKKSPQKINITIEQDENYVLFNPIIKSNVEYVKLDFYLNNFKKKINIGDYIPKDAYLRANFYLKNNVDELTVFTFNGVNIGYKRSIVDDTAFNIGLIYNYDSPQEVNITIDEYIRYEDIVQPYPVLLRFKDENDNEVSWGGKFKVGSAITRIGSFNDCNLLKGIYTVSNAKLNGSPLPSTPHVVERQMVFTCTATWAFDNNEPKSILSPRLLRIPNSSYKILGYIPDISGHGNHGVIHNSAYAEGSGVNEDGSYQLDGVDDHITIPTLSRGGKQVLMKVNWNTIDSIIYDQRHIGGFAIYCSDYINTDDSITVPAYRGRNAAGTTYIDGIRNEYVIASQLRNVTHNIVEILGTSYTVGNINPIIGKSAVITRYGNLALYDFMLFDEISTDDKILELNEYVGIEGNTE